MAKLGNGLSGGFSGRMGGVIGYVWRGKWCVRSMPSQYRDAKSELQLERRSLFKQTLNFTSRARKVLHVGLRTRSLDAHITEYNYFMRINKYCFALDDGELQVDYGSLVLAEGPVAPVAFDAPRLIGDTAVSIDFEKNPLHRVTHSEDSVYVAAYCPETNEFDLSLPAYRRCKRLEMNLRDTWAGREVHLWGFVADGKGRASMSQYLGGAVLRAQTVELVDRQFKANKMITDVNPVAGGLRPADVDRSGLVPRRYVMRNGQTINVFADNNIGLLKMDFIFEAGTALQTKKLQAAAAIHLLTEGTRHHSSREIAEFIDFRGLIVEKTNDEVSSTLTVYGMPRYLSELLPLVKEMIACPTYPQEEFDVFLAKRKQQLMTNLQRTSYVARKRFYECLYGQGHPLGQYALPEELDGLTAQDVREFHDKYLTFSRMSIVLGGTMTDKDLALFDDVFGNEPVADVERTVLPGPLDVRTGLQKVSVPGAVQTTLKVGRRLPFSWDDIDYSRFMILSTLLGGYFGSRLMSNIREEKGYTYGINAMTRIYRGSIGFSITTDVAVDKAEAALKEIMLELGRLRDEPVGAEELELVRRCMLGDFMRSVDGIFERSERFCQMMTNGVTERFTDNFMSVLEEGAVTPESLMSLAQSVLREEDMTMVMAGNI